MHAIDLTFELTTLEDFHIGTGLDCVGKYDDGQVKDEKGYPSIRSETLKGLLRQSCREIRKVFKGKFGLAYEEIFGFHNMGSLDISIEYLDGPTRPFVIHTFTAIKAGVARKGTLREIEFGSKGCKFCCRIHFDVIDDAVSKKIKQLLEMGIKNLKWIGGSRRRGFGAVQCRLIEDDCSSARNDISAIGDGISFTLLLEMQDAVCLSGAGQVGNHIHTLDYITGTTALGMFRNILLKISDTDDLSFMDDGNVLITNFYPTNQAEIGNGVVTPAPASLRKRKTLDKYLSYYQNHRQVDDKMFELPHWAIDTVSNDGEAFNDFLNYINQDTLIEDNIKDGEGFSDKSISGEYIVFSNKDFDLSRAKVFKPRKEQVMRNAISPDTQTADTQGLFTQDMLVKHTWFTGTITFPDKSKAERFKKVYDNWLTGKRNFHVGRGGKPVKVIDIKSDITGQENKKTWGDFKNNVGEYIFTLTLVSDLILYDERLMPETVLHPRYLGLENELKLEKHVTSSRIHQSYSGLAGLRRFSDKVITKGSCFLYRLKDVTNLDHVKKRLMAYQIQGIGVKKEEGFGQVIVNFPVHSVSRAKLKFPGHHYTFMKSEIPHFLASDLETMDSVLIEAQKLANNYTPKADSTFINRIISYMEADVSEKKIQTELSHHISKKTKAGDHWKIFHEKIWKRYFGPDGMDTDQNIRQKTYQLIKLAYLLMKWGAMCNGKSQRKKNCQKSNTEIFQKKEKQRKRATQCDSFF